MNVEDLRILKVWKGPEELDECFNMAPGEFSGIRVNSVLLVMKRIAHKSGVFSIARGL